MQEDIEVFTGCNLKDRMSLSTITDNDIEDIKIDVNILYKTIEDMNKRNRNLWRYRTL